MKYIYSLSLVCVLITLPAYASTPEQRAAQSRSIVTEFMTELKQALQTTLNKDGALAAIKVCNVSAPAIAQKQSELHNMNVGRTSLKVRNPDNAPNQWEINILEDFEKRKAAGEQIQTLEHYEVLTENGEQWFRYMKAIPTAEKPCLICHGSNLAPEIKSVLDELYPNDQARGYKAGDIRGAFTLKQRIEP